MGRIYYFATASCHAGQDQQADGTWLSQTRRCGNTSRPLRWPTWKSVAHDQSDVARANLLTIQEMIMKQEKPAMNRTFENPTFEKIDHERRHFLGAAAFTLAAAQLDLLPSASAQSGTPDESGTRTETLFPGFAAESVRTGGTTVHVLRKG